MSTTHLAAGKALPCLSMNALRVFFTDEMDIRHAFWFLILLCEYVHPLASLHIYMLIRA
jgi:hypothetical protein